MKRIQIGVIGLGNMGSRHARVYSQFPNVELVAFSDIKGKFPKDYPVDYFLDYKEMVKNKKLDLVSICVPTSLHFEVAKECLKKGINVLLEKPITSTVSEAEELFQLSEENNLKFLVGHIERFNPALKVVKKIVDAQEIGKIISLNSRRVGGFPPQITDADVSIDLAIHDVDISNYLIGRLPISVYKKALKNLIEKRADSVEFFLDYSDCCSYIQANWITPAKIRKLYLTSTKGYLELDYIKQEVVFFKSNFVKELNENFSDFILHFSNPDVFKLKVCKAEPLKEEIAYMINCINNDIKIDSSFALDSLKIVINDNGTNI